MNNIIENADQIIATLKQEIEQLKSSVEMWKSHNEYLREEWYKTQDELKRTQQDLEGWKSASKHHYTECCKAENALRAAQKEIAHLTSGEPELEFGTVYEASVKTLLADGWQIFDPEMRDNPLAYSSFNQNMDDYLHDLSCPKQTIYHECARDNGDYPNEEYRVCQCPWDYRYTPTPGNYFPISLDGYTYPPAKEDLSWDNHQPICDCPDGECTCF